MWAALLLATPLGVFYALRRSWVDDVRAHALMAVVASGCVLTAITEFLSLGRALAFGPLLAAWTFAALASAVVATWAWRRRAPSAQIALEQALRGLSRTDVILMACLLVIVVPTGVIAMIAEPNNWDSLTYHLSRVMHWIQDRSVAMYPTHCLRQLYQNPWAEYAILNLMVLGGDDRLANLVQWMSMLGSLIGVSLLARQLHAGPRGQVLAAVVCATIPMGILQSTSTQTDYVTAFWMVCFVLFALRWMDAALAADRAEPVGPANALAMGAALGLAILTKATTYVLALPFLAWTMLALIRARKVSGLAMAAVAMTLTLAINLGHYVRSAELFGNPLGPGRESATMVFANETFTPASVSSNILRNVAVNLGTRWGGANLRIEQAVDRAHEALGISPDDPRTTWYGTHFAVPRLSRHEDLAGNPLHLVLICGVLAICFLRSRLAVQACYGACLVGAFVLFCAAAKWQPWISRLQLPLFVLATPLVGAMLARTRPQWLSIVTAAVLLVAALPYVIENETRPLIGPMRLARTSNAQQYFINRARLAEPYLGAASALAALDCRDVGIDIGGDDLEYPLWVFLRKEREGAFRIEHVDVHNVSAGLTGPEQPGGPFQPCALFRELTDPPAAFSLDGADFYRAWMSGTVAVYTRRTPPG